MQINSLFQSTREGKSTTNRSGDARATTDFTAVLADAANDKAVAESNALPSIEVPKDAIPVPAFTLPKDGGGAIPAAVATATWMTSLQETGGREAVAKDGGNVGDGAPVVIGKGSVGTGSGGGGSDTSGGTGGNQIGGTGGNGSGGVVTGTGSSGTGNTAGSGSGTETNQTSLAKLLLARLASSQAMSSKGAIY